MPLTVLTSTNDAEKHSLDITSLVFYNNKLYSAADDGKIKAWSENLELIAEAQAHPCSVFSICIGNDTLYSCSNDGSVKAWSLDNLKRKYTVLQEENEMYKVCFDRTNGKLYVGDDYGYVKILVNDEVIGIMEIMHPIVDMLAIGEIIYTARDLYVIITQIDSIQRKIATLKAIQGRAPVCVSGGKLWFTSRSGRDILVHENSLESDFKPIGEIKAAHELIINAICGVTADNTICLLSGGWDKVIKKWKLTNDSLIESVSNCPVDMVIMSITTGTNGNIYVGGDNGSILLIEDKT